MSGCPFKKLFQNENGAINILGKSKKHSVASPFNEQVNKYYRELNNSEENALISFIEINKDDLHNLMKLKPILEEKADEIVNSFYDQLLKINNLKDIISEHSTVERLKMTFRNYLMDMVSGENMAEQLSSLNVELTGKMTS